jgi:hypothetical protein
MDEEVRDHTRDILRDVRRIGSVFAGRTKRQTEAALEEAAPAGGLLGLGMLVAGVGSLLLLATPIVPKRQRRIRRRMLALSGLYVVAGGAAAMIGGAATRNAVRARARHAARDIGRGAEVIKDEVEREMQ